MYACQACGGEVGLLVELDREAESVVVVNAGPASDSLDLSDLAVTASVAASESPARAARLPGHPRAADPARGCRRWMPKELGVLRHFSGPVRAGGAGAAEHHHGLLVDQVGTGHLALKSSYEGCPSRRKRRFLTHLADLGLRQGGTTIATSSNFSGRAKRGRFPTRPILARPTGASTR